MRTVLLADEDPESRLLLLSALQRWGYATVEALAEPDILQLAADGDIGLILISCSLPGVNAFDLSRHLHYNQLTSTIPLVLLTAQCDEAIRAQGKQAGVDGYLLKPVLLSEFITCLHRYMPFGGT